MEKKLRISTFKCENEMTNKQKAIDKKQLAKTK